MSERTDIITLPRRRKLQWAAGIILFAIVILVAVWQLSSGRVVALNAATNEVSASRAPLPVGGKNDALSDKQPLANAAAKPVVNAARAIKPAKEESVLVSLFKGKTPEVCGMSKSEVEAHIAANIGVDDFAGSNLALKTNIVLSDAIRKLIQSEKLSEQAVGLYVMANQAGASAMESESLNQPGCKQSDECALKPFEALQRARAASAEPLVKLAQSSNDAGVYAAALYACLGNKTGACGKISYARWAEIEPDNAAAWLSAASEAESRKDDVARIAALQRAVDAKEYDLHLPRLAGVAESASVQAQSPIEQSTTYSALFIATMMPGWHATGAVFRHCGRKELMDDARRATCDALATKVAEKDETLVAVMMAKSIGERLGWSAERQQLYKDEYSVATGQALGGITDENMLSCETIQKSNQRTLRIFQIGERAAAREAVEKSGKTLAEAAAQYRKPTTQ